MTCPLNHNNLPRGLQCRRGYLELTVKVNGRRISNSYCGKHTERALVLASERLAKIRSEIELGRFGIAPELPEKTFAEVFPIYFELWANERNGDGSFKHDPANVKIAKLVAAKHLLPVFGPKLFHAIRTVDLEQHREVMLRQGISGTTVNRVHNILGSMYSHFKTWIALEKLSSFKLPESNPKAEATKAPLQKRERLPTDYELKKIKNACIQRKDFDAWEIVKMALETTLSKKDLKNLEAGTVIDTTRSKTGVAIHLPVSVLTKLNFINWTKRWKEIRKDAGVTDIQLRDLRKRGINQLIGHKHDIKLVSQFAGHASVATTERIYTKTIHEKLKPLAEDLHNWVESI